MNKRLILALVSIVFLFTLVNYVHASGVTICGTNYDCSWTSDSICPETYGATCRGSSCDIDCSYGAGTACHTTSDCTDHCTGSTRYYSGTCTYNCLCSYSSEDCSTHDDWYCNADGVTKEHRIYGCSANACTYTASQQTNCNLQDGWYDTGNVRTLSDRYAQKEQVYRDYSCSVGSCTFTVGTTQWVNVQDCGATSYTCTNDYTRRYAYTSAVGACGAYTNDVSCGATTNTCPNVCTARHSYTCSGGACGSYISDSYASWNQSCVGGSITSGSCGVNGCVGDYYRDYGCASGTCTHNDDNCNDCSCSCGNYNTNEANYCSDGKDNDCDGLTDRMDPDCGVSITSISASNSVEQGQSFTVSCGSSVGPVNCISASINGRACTWTSWDGNSAIFTCTATTTCPATETAKCYVDTSKCAALSPTERTTSVNVNCTTCGSYASSSTCNSDSRCTWCSKCSSTKYTGGDVRCVDAGTCNSYCWNGQCGATCDDTNGGCTSTSQCSGTVYQTRAATCMNSCSCSYDSWTNGTCAQSKTNCGAQCGADSDCITSTRCTGHINETRTGSCDATCSCTYSAWTPNICAVSKSTCGAECATNSDCASNNTIIGDYCYYGSACNAQCTCSNSSAYCPVPGTASSGVCYYGSRTCQSSGCGLSSCNLNTGDRCDATDGCVFETSTMYVSVNSKIWTKTCGSLANTEHNILAPETGDNLYACVTADVYRKGSNQLLFRCTNSGQTRCTIRDVIIDKGTPVQKNYLQLHPTWAASTNTADNGEWTLPLTRGEDSDINTTICIGDTSVCGTGDSEFSFENPYILETNNWYPDLRNYVIPAISTGEPNFTLGMPIKMYSQITRPGIVASICESPECQEFYGVDGSAGNTMSWDSYEKAFYVEYDSKLIGTNGCNQLHFINMSVTDGTVTNQSISYFYISCSPSIVIDPIEKRTVLDVTDIDTFRICMWNPRDCKRYTITMSTVDPQQAYILNLLKLNCTDTADCVTGTNFISFSLCDMQSGCGNVTLTKAARSGSYPILFSSVADDNPKTYNAIGSLLIFSESLPEFAPIYIIVIIAVGAILWSTGKFNVIKKKK